MQFFKKKIWYYVRITMSYKSLKHRALKRHERMDETSLKSPPKSYSSLDLSSDVSLMDITPNTITDKKKEQPKLDVAAEDFEATISTDNSIGQDSAHAINSEESKDDNTSFLHLSETSSFSEYSHSDDLESSTLSDLHDEVAVPSYPEEEKTLRQELRDLAIKHSKHITNSFLNDLLVILRTAGHTDLPKTAETLLQTQRSNNRIVPMLTKKGTYGSYMYLGIKDQLQFQITGSGYTDKEIRVLVNVDGLPIFNRSKQQMWPILVQILHKDYYCKPFAAALYCGDSKPHDGNTFFRDFIEEVTTLIEHGFLVEGTVFTFEIAAFVCDTPARAFIKCCKGHTAFYGCERCSVHGETINKRRVYPEMNCRLRTKKSFLEKRQPGHHIPDITSPLVRIPGFDPVRGVVLDYMHLLCCGVMKSLFDKWLSSRKQKGNIGRRERYHLTELLLASSVYIPMEFQRKVLDVTDISNWKATQYRLFLLYAGGLILRHVLSSETYQHFLLLFVACRILCSRSWSLIYTDEAESFLREFFKKMPSLYGKDSQVMNFHNLIHLADDVRVLRAPLIEYSSFPFENCLGNIKRLIRTPRNPVAQVFRRLSEQGSLGSKIKKYDFGINNEQAAKSNTFEYTQISIKTITVSLASPDNVVILANNDIFEVSRIFSTDNAKSIHIEGKCLEKKGNAFKTPMASSKIGIYKVGRPIRHKKVYSIDKIVEKCFMMNVEERKYAVTLLHV